MDPLNLVEHQLNQQRQRIAELEAAEARVKELEFDADRACPCLYTTPCDPCCTCVDHYQSRGCDRCCTYGSPEQRRIKAEYLVRQESDANRWKKVKRRFYQKHSDFWVVSGFWGDLADTIEQAVDKLEEK